MAVAILGLAGLFFVGHLLQWVFLKTKIPDLLILIALGFLIGPSGMAFVSYESLGQVGVVLATVTLIIILYEGGLNLNASDLIRSSLPSLSLSFLSFFLIVFFTTLFLAPFVSFPTALLIGLGIGSTSSAVVFPLIKPLNIKEETKTRLSLESAFTDVLAIIAFLAVLESILTENYKISSLVLSFGTKPFISIVIGVCFALLWSFLRKSFVHLFNRPFSTEAWSLLSYAMIELFNLNGPIGILAFGFALANLNLIPSFLSGIFNLKPIPDNEIFLLKEISFLLKTFFFLYLGMLIKLSAFNVFVLAVLLTLLIFATRYLAVRLVFSNKKFSYFDALISMGMGPRGLACAVLATLPLQKGYIHGEFIQNLIFYIILISIISTSVFVIFGQKVFFQKLFSPFFKSYLNTDSRQADSPSLNSSDT